ncbi:MAG: glycine cleavage T C-terminal barrel domain-containing protein, partial [Pseudomonadota bacterium]
PWMRAKEIEVAGHTVWAFRMSYAGELGWEFHGDFDAIGAIYSALWAAGEAHGLRDYGSFAMNAMRMEKGFKGAGELTNEVTVREADVMRFVREDKEFRGKEGSLAEPRFQCVYLSIDGDGVNDGNGGEAVLKGDDQVGTVSSIAWGHGVERLLAFAYVAPEHVEPGSKLQVVVMGDARDAEVLADPVYDPESHLPRG